MTKECEERINAESLKTVLDKHQHWLNEDCENWEEMRANLCGVDLSDAALSDAALNRVNLCNANLRGANLHNTDLSYTNLCNADLSYTNLHRANLSGADLRGADLRDADLRGTDLHNANLCNADLCNANLRGAYLLNADLSGADLRGAVLRDALLSEADLSGALLSEAHLCNADLRDTKNVPYIPMVCPEEGDFIGWKKAEGNKDEVIVKLRIPSDAKRSSATTRKCRCSKAEVIAIYNLDGTEAEETTCHSNYDNSFIYEVGKTVEVTDFSEDRWNECAEGIHFFINKQEAIDY